MDQFLYFNVGQIGQVLILLTVLYLMYKDQNKRLLNIEEEMKQFRAVLISVARQDERMNAMDQRMLAQGRRIDSLQNASWSSEKERT